MVSIVLDRTREQISVVRRFLDTVSLVRDFVANHANSTNVDLKQEAATFRAALPAAGGLSVFLHCATITHLYAIYESFVADAITEYLDSIRRVITYRKLSPTMRRAHIVGLGRVISRITRARYRNLNADSLLIDLYGAIGRRGGGNIAPEAFLDRDANLRFGELNKLLMRCALNDLQSWLAHHSSITTYMASSRMSSSGAMSTDPVSELRRFVEDRNEASHESRRIGQPLGPSELKAYADFIESLCTTIGQYIDHSIIHERTTAAPGQGRALILKRFRRVGAIGLEAYSLPLAVGQKLYAIGNYFCFPTEIISLRNGATPLTSVAAHGSIQLGAVLSPEPPIGAELVPA